jgi:hypothetical protein
MNYLAREREEPSDQKTPRGMVNGPRGFASERVAEARAGRAACREHPHRSRAPGVDLPEARHAHAVRRRARARPRRIGHPEGMGDTGLEPVTPSLSSLGRAAQPWRITAVWATLWARRTEIVQSGSQEAVQAWSKRPECRPFAGVACDIPEHRADAGAAAEPSTLRGASIASA